MLPPETPSDYARRVLVCVTGMSPQVVTETIYALAVRQEPAFVPTEVHLVSTGQGVEQARLELATSGNDQLGRLCREYALDRSAILFDESTLHVITDAEGMPLDDLRSASHNNDAADCLVRVIRQFTDDEQCALHVSIAGGRKTLGFFAGYVLSLLGREQDRLSHVLVSEPFENERQFFYPPAKPSVIDVKGRAADAHKAEVTLAEIPFVRLRNNVDAKLIKNSAAGYRVLVRGAERSLAEGRLEIRFARRDKQLQVLCGGTPVRFQQASDAALYCYFAERAAQGLPPISRNDIDLRGDVLRQLKRYLVKDDGAVERFERRLEEMDGSFDARTGYFEQAGSRIRRSLVQALGGGSPLYEVHRSGDKGQSVYGLRLPASNVRVIDKV